MVRALLLVALAVFFQGCASAPPAGEESSRLEKLLLDRERAMAGVEARLREQPAVEVEAVTSIRNLAWVTQSERVQTLEERLRREADKWLPTAPVMVKMKSQLETERQRLAQIPESIDSADERSTPAAPADLLVEKRRLQVEIEALRTSLHLLR